MDDTLIEKKHKHILNDEAYLIIDLYLFLPRNLGKLSCPRAFLTLWSSESLFTSGFQWQYIAAFPSPKVSFKKSKEWRVENMKR